MSKQIIVSLGVIFLLAATFGLQYGREQLFASAEGETLCHAKNVYREARNQSFLGQWMVAYVTTNRAEENRSYWGGDTLCGVTFARIGKTAQFSWTDDPLLLMADPEDLQDQTSWEWSLATARLVEWTGLSVPGLEKATNYLNPKTAGRKHLCWFERNLIYIKSVGDHDFYREPLEGEDDGARFGCDKAPIAKTAPVVKTVPIPVPRPA